MNCLRATNWRFPPAGRDPAGGRQAHAGTRVRIGGGVGSGRTGGIRARQGLHRGGRRQRAGNASFGSDPPPRARTVHAAGRQGFCDRVAQSNPKVVEDLVPKMLSLSVIQRVLQNLLRERVSIRDSVTHHRSAGRSRTHDEESDPAHRVRAAGYPARHYQAII